MGKLLIVCLLLGTSAVLLSQNSGVDAKPFLLSPNFFVLTTRAPASGEHSQASATTFQFPDFITPKLRFLTSLLQNSNSGGGSGSFGFGVKKVIGFNIASTTEKTTTYKPDSTTPVVTHFMPESTESSFESITSKTTTADSSTAFGGYSENPTPTVGPTSPATTTTTTTQKPFTKSTSNSGGYEYTTEGSNQSPGTESTTKRPSPGYEYSTEQSNQSPVTESTTKRPSPGYEYSTEHSSQSPGYEYTTKRPSLGYQYSTEHSSQSPGYEYTSKRPTSGYEYTTVKPSGYGYRTPDSENEVLNVSVGTQYLPVVRF